MNEMLDRAKRRYKETALPDELAFAVSSALRTGERKRKRSQYVRRSFATLAACAASFALLVNVNPAFASAMESLPVLGPLAGVFTVSRYSIADRNHLIDVRLPALENTGHTDLEQRINTEIRQKIDAVLDEAEQRAQETRDAYVATGGRAEDFIPIIIDVDYDVKCQNEQYLSFLVTKTETLAAAYTEYYVYNIDLGSGRELSLSDLLGPDWKRLANEAVAAGIEARSKEEGNLYFDGTDGVEGFTSIADDQRFFINAAGNPVILFEKYEIAPGYMGPQEFEVAVLG